MYKIHNILSVETLWTMGDAVIAARNPEEAVSQLEDYLTNHPDNPLRREGSEDAKLARSIGEIKDTGRFCASKGVIYESLLRTT